MIALAALAGFQGALRQEILGRTPEIALSTPPGTDTSELAARIRDLPAVETAQAVLEGSGWILRDGAARPVSMVAYEGELPTLFPGVEGLGGEDGRPQGLYLGDELAATWGLMPGDTVEIVAARPLLTPLGPQPRVRRIPMAGTFTTGRTEYRDRIALPWEIGRGLIGRGGERILAGSGDLERVDELSAAMAPLLPEGTRVETWRDRNQALLFALRLEKTLMFLGIFLIVVVASLALVSSLLLILASKRHEVGMLRAMGATRASVRSVFLWLGAILAGAGAAAGAIAGCAIAWALDRWRLLRLPDQVYFLDHVPFELAPLDFAAVLVTSVGLAAVCATWASHRAATLDPVGALRR